MVEVCGGSGSQADEALASRLLKEEMRSNTRAIASPKPPPGGKVRKAGRGLKAPRPVWEMVPEELDDLATAMREHEATADLRALGSAERVKEYNRLQRTANSYADVAKADEAAKKLQAIEDSLTPEQQNILFGIGEPDPWGATGVNAHNAESIRDLRGALDSIEVEGTAQELGYSLRRAATDIGTATDPAKMDPGQLRAFMQLRYGFERAAERGLDLQEVTDAMLKAAGARFSDPADAAFMLERFAKKPKRPK